MIFFIENFPLTKLFPFVILNDDFNKLLNVFISLSLRENFESTEFIFFKQICFSITSAPFETAKHGIIDPIEWSERPTLQLNFFFRISILFRLKSILSDG